MNSEIEQAKEEILYWMLDYIGEGEDEYFEHDGELPYQKQDVEVFESLIDGFIIRVSNSKEKSNFQWVKNEVKDLVIKLNNLNYQHNQRMIETDQREGICALIDQVIINAGHSASEDITLEWRDW